MGKGRRRKKNYCLGASAMNWLASPSVSIFLPSFSLRKAGGGNKKYHYGNGHPLLPRQKGKSSADYGMSRERINGQVFPDIELLALLKCYSGGSTDFSVAVVRKSVNERKRKGRGERTPLIKMQA